MTDNLFGSLHGVVVPVTCTDLVLRLKDWFYYKTYLLRFPPLHYHTIFHIRLSPARIICMLASLQYLYVAMLPNTVHI